VDLRLLIDRQHDGVLWGIQMQAHHIADLGLQLWVGGELESLRPPRLDAEPPPQPG
jgi:hypothetical protein